MITNDDKLRDSYLSLACEYEKLAEDFGGPPDHLVKTTGPERCDPTPARFSVNPSTPADWCAFNSAPRTFCRNILKLKVNVD